MASHNDQIDELAVRCRFDPLAWGYAAWDWGVGRLEHVAGPREWQADVLTVIRDHLADPATRFEPLQISIASGHGIGKAQPVDIVIETPDGPRVWGDLTSGDMVFGADGAPVRINAVRRFKNRPVMRVTFSDGSSAIVDEEHEWTVRGRQDRRLGLDWRTMSTKDILAAGVKRRNGASLARQWEIPANGPAQYPHADLPLHPYVMGAWLGDGTKGTAAITSADTEMFEHITFLGYEVSEKDRNSSGGQAQTRTILGIKQHLPACTTYNCRVPGAYLRGDIEQRTQLLQGLLDTDGWVEASGTVMFGSVSPGLAQDVLFLARSLGIVARDLGPKPTSYISPDGVRINCADVYRVSMTYDGTPLFSLPRKRDALHTVEARYTTRWIDSVESVGTSETMCISVDSQDGLYLTSDFLVTHNSALMGIVSNWAESCWADAKIVCTANTEAQLRTKTVPEVSMWFRESITADWFDVQATSIKSKSPSHSDSWRMDFIPWSHTNTEAFAGLHNQGRIIVLLFDEASKIHDKVWEVAEGALTDENTVIIWLAFGNPTQNSGRFRECFRKYRHRWHNRHIDSRTVPGTNKKKIQQWVDDYGEDSDFVKVRVRGVFPSQSARQFISAVDVDASRGREIRPEQYSFAPKVIGCDPAWTGDDELVIGMRQGLLYKTLMTMPYNDDDILVANILAQLEDEHNADAVVVDGGFGTGIVSAGRNMGRGWHLVWYAGKSPDPGCLNMRAFMWKSIRDWCKQGGSFDPDDDVLYDDLIGPETVSRLDGKIQIESKEDMKERGLPSPNRGDTLGLTFAIPVTNTAKVPSGQNIKNCENYKPF